MCGVIVLGVAALISCVLAWNGLIQQRVAFSRKKDITGPAAVTIGIICLILGLILSVLTLLLLSLILLRN